VALLVQGVPGFVVGLPALPHLPEDLQPPLPQSAQRAGVALAFLALPPVVGPGPGAELIGPAKDLQPSGGRVRPPQFVGVKELFPFAFPGLDQVLRRGEGGDELPAEGRRPVVKGFQRGRIVFDRAPVLRSSATAEGGRGPGSSTGSSRLVFEDRP
jgi:hypothetical protein